VDTSPLRRIQGFLVDDEEPPGLEELPPEATDAVPGNAAKQVGALTLQKVGDVVVDPKTVLAWVLAAVGAPASLVGLLVPVRESGSLLPQVGLMPWVRRFPVRRWLWVLGALGQAAAVVAMAVATAMLRGVSAGVAILAALAAFALARSLSSITSKDVLGRTIPKGQRGQVTGFATVASGAVAITLGLAVRALGGQEAQAAVFAWLLASASLTWVAAAWVFSTVVESAGEHDRAVGAGVLASVRTAFTDARDLLAGDAAFRRFVVARTLLLVSALSPPFVVALSTRETGAAVAQLGPFVAASGIAALVGGPLWGRAADRSSRLVMTAGAAGASGVIVVLLASLALPALRGSAWTYPVAYLGLALVHTGVRIGRKTYVVDLAEGNRRTDYVATSNTVMGALLLITGVVSAGLAALGTELALGFLALLGLAGVVVSWRLPEVTP
jgi:hypothetical protein